MLSDTENPTTANRERLDIVPARLATPQNLAIGGHAVKDEAKS